MEPGTARPRDQQLYFDQLDSVDSLEKLREFINSGGSDVSTDIKDSEPLSGLAVFLEKHCSDRERERFFSSTLKLIVSCARTLKPETVIPCIRAQERTCLGVVRELVASLLANAFLCTHPHPGHGTNNEEKQSSTLFTFASLYRQLKEGQTDKTDSMVALLKCFLSYFETLDKNRALLNETIAFQRQGLPLDEVPSSLSEWEACQIPLCGVSIERNGCLDDSALHNFLQVHLEISGNETNLLPQIAIEILVDCTKISFSGDGISCSESVLYPELLVSRVILDQLEDNEALVINGLARFVLDDSGKCQTWKEQSGQMGVHGNNIPTSIVVMDGITSSPGDPLALDMQYTEHYTLKEMNRALAGFISDGGRDFSLANFGGRALAELDGDVIVTGPSFTLSVDIPRSESYSSSLYPEPSLSAPGSVMGDPSSLDTVAEYPCESSSESEARAPCDVAKMSTTSVSSLVGSIIQSAVTKATSDGAAAETAGGEAKESRENGNETKVEELACSVTGSILSSILSPETGSGGEKARKVEALASGLSSSILSSAISTEKNSVKKTEGKKVEKLTSDLSGSILSSVLSPAQTVKGKEKVEALASNLSGSILSSVLEKPSTEPTSSGRTNSDPHSSSHTTTKQNHSVTADLLARNIIADVLFSSRDERSPTPPPQTSFPQTVGQPTSPAVEWRVHSFADKMADRILAGVFSKSATPVVAVRKPSLSEAGGQSSSVTGQTITLHEFTDDLVEGAVREGLLIAHLQARCSDRETDSGAGEQGGAENEEEKEEEDGELSTRVAIAEQLVSQSIESVLEDVMENKLNKRMEIGQEKSESARSLKMGGARKRSESPMRSKQGLLRQALDRPKYLASSLPEIETNELEQSTSSSLLQHLSAPSSSRLSYAWSVASTRDEGSRPVSPTDLDRLALSFVGSLEEYYSLFAELVIRGAIAEVTGNKKDSLLSAEGEVSMFVPTLHHPLSSGGEETGEVGGGGGVGGRGSSRVDTYLSTLVEVETIETETADQNTSHSETDVLRKVATGNWGCGGDPQLMFFIQWCAVSASGRSEMLYFPSNDQRMERCAEVAGHVQAKHWTTGQLVLSLQQYCRLSHEERGNETLFSFILNQ